MKNYLLISIISFVLFPISIFSETVLLKGKETIKGKIKNQNINSVRIEVDGKTIEISKDKILKIVYRDLNKEEEQKIREEEERKLAKEKNPTKQAEEKKEAEAKNPSKESEAKLADEKSKPEEQSADEQDSLKKKALEQEKKNTPSRARIVVYSVLLPGFGQFKEKRYIAAFAYPTLIIGTSLLAYNEYKHYKNSLNDYNTMSNPSLETQFLAASIGGKITYNNYAIYNQKAAVRKNYEHARNIGYAVIALYLINIIDAYFFYNENAFTENKTRGIFMDVHVEALASQTGINQQNTKYDQFYNIGYSWRF